MLNYQNEMRDNPHLTYRDFKAFFEASAQAMFVENRDGYIVALNAAACDLWGSQTSEIVGKHASEVLPPKLGISKIGKVRRSHHIRPDQTIEVEVLSTPISLGDDEAFLTIVCQVVEENPDRQAAQALAKCNCPDLHTAKMEALERLANRISHDFNNILTSVVGFGSLVQGDDTLSEANQGYIDQMLGAAKRAEVLTGELLSFGRRSQCPKTSFDPATAIQKAHPQIREILGSEISLTTLCEDNVAQIAGTEQALSQILLQLATNTREASSGTVEGEMKIELSSDESGSVILRVSDDGPGMDELCATAAFEPFFSSNTDKKMLGLGLSRVYTTTRNLGGTVALSSVHGSGTEFTFTFQPACSNQSPTPPPDTPILGSLPALRPMTSHMATENAVAPAQQPKADAEAEAAGTQKDEAPKDEAPKDEKDEAPKDEVPKDEVPKDEAPKREKDEVPKGEAPKTDEKKPANRRSSLPGGDETILVVEDEPMVREIVVRSLSHLGYTVHKACDGQEGLEITREFVDDIDLIFSDIVMPRLSGPEMIQRIRDENLNVPVLFTTGFTESRHLLENGGDLREGIDLLPKPYTPNVLAERVRAKLDSLCEPGHAS